MGAFEYRQAEEIRDAFARHGVRYLFIGKSGAILLGFPDTTQDADLFVEKSPANGQAIVASLRELGFDLDDEQAAGASLRYKEANLQETAEYGLKPARSFYKFDRLHPCPRALPSCGTSFRA